MKTTTDPNTKTPASNPDMKNWELPLLAKARKFYQVTVTENAGNEPAFLRATLAQHGAEAADDAARRIYGLIRTLNEAYERLTNAGTIDDAKNAVSWLRTDAWDTVQRDIATLDAISQALRA